MPQDPAEFDDLPEPLADDLRRLYRADVQASPAVDQAILNRARAHVAGRKRTLPLLLQVAAAAAAIILITAMLLPTMQSARRSSTHRPIARQVTDINADGIIDIRDALALQQSINAGRTSAHDITGDGVTDKRDVDAIAMLAVRIDRGTTR
jgi:hypothetical protein